MFIMLWNLSAICHFIYFLISGAKSKNKLRGYVTFKWNIIKKFFFVILWFLIIDDLYYFYFSDLYIFQFSEMWKI